MIEEDELNESEQMIKIKMYFAFFKINFIMWDNFFDDVCIHFNNYRNLTVLRGEKNKKHPFTAI